MNAFDYVAVTNAGQALRERVSRPHSAYLAGGTNLIDDMKLRVETHDLLIDVNKMGYADIIPLPHGGLRIGANVRNSTLAYDPRIQTQYPLLSQALLSGASPQLRNAATTAGNLLQRTRCYYFRDGTSPCNKRDPGSGCSALVGYNRIHAILGTSQQCIATHPSDMDVAMMALDVTIRTRTATGERTIPIADFYVPYGDDPARENTLQPGELITAVDLPMEPWFTRSTYVKARDRASYEFALASAAVALDIHNGTIRDCRIALGGVATKPWRAHAAESVLRGSPVDATSYQRAADAELLPAVAHTYNGFKIELAKRVIMQALQTAAALG